QIETCSAIKAVPGIGQIQADANRAVGDLGGGSRIFRETDGGHREEASGDQGALDHELEHSCLCEVGSRRNGSERRTSFLNVPRCRSESWLHHCPLISWAPTANHYFFRWSAHLFQLPVSPLHG